jgi:transcriptional regulator with XRE-family HTH domain
MERQTIRDLRRAAGWSQRDLAARIGVSKMSVSHWETARNEPSARQLRLLAEAFGVGMEAIAFERDAAQAALAAMKGQDR